MSLSGKPPRRIFISYRRDDTQGEAGRLADSLNLYFGPGRVFRDIEGIATGADFEDVINQTARQADAMIVLIGRRWLGATDATGAARLHNSEDWVAREIAAALAIKIPIYPVLVESAVMPRPEELPESLRPLVRFNAMSISDHRWQTDVTRLAKIVAIDVPGSAAEVTLQIVQWVASAALFVAIAGTSGLVAFNLFHARDALSLGESGATFVVVDCCAVLLLYFAHLVDVERRIYTYLAVLAGLVGTLVFFIVLGILGKDNPHAPIMIFFGSTMTATAVLALMGLSGFKAR